MTSPPTFPNEVVVRVLGINAALHRPSAALVIDGEVVAIADDLRPARDKPAHVPTALPAVQMPHHAARQCLLHAGIEPRDLHAVAFSYDPSLALSRADVTDGLFRGLKAIYARRAPHLLRTMLPGLHLSKVRYVSHHLSHATSAYASIGWSDCAVLVLDGGGEGLSHLAGILQDGELQTLAAQRLPHSLGLLYEDLTAHLGFERTFEEAKVMTLARRGEPTLLAEMKQAIFATGDGGFVTEALPWRRYAPKLRIGDQPLDMHADLACSVQLRLEEVVIDLAKWLYERTGKRRLAFAGGVALNDLIRARLQAEGPFEEVWVPPMPGDAGTALGAAFHVASLLGDEIVSEPFDASDPPAGAQDDWLCADGGSSDRLAGRDGPELRIRRSRQTRTDRSNSPAVSV